MSNNLINWEINCTNHDLLDINAALEEMQREQTHEGFSIPALDYSELDMFDSVSVSFAIPLEFADLTQDTPIKTIDELMDPSYRPVIDTDYRSSYPPDDQADAMDNLSFNFNQNIQLGHSDPLQALQEITASTPDLLDATRAHWDIGEITDYQAAPLFSYHNVDLDSYDITSIKVEDYDLDFPGASTDWPSIFAEIERHVKDVFSQDISDTFAPDVQYKAVRSGMTLVKGKGRSPGKSLFNIPEYSSQNIFSFNEGHDGGKSFNIPIHLSMESGELVFKINFNDIDLNDLAQISRLPAEMNMKSVLSLLPRKKKAK